jgi:peptidoglycan/LPS O-acetylase OafA/YrhL
MNLTGSRLVLGPLWTLPLEVQMYLVLPFIFLLTRRATDLGRIGILFGLSLLAAWTLPAIAGRLYGATFAPCFMAGIVAYALRDRITPRLSGSLWPLFLLAAVLVYIGIEGLLEGVVHFALQDSLCLAVGVALPLFRQSNSAMLNRVTHLLARYSYGVYLFHCIALWIGIFWIRPRSFWLGALLALVLLVTLAVAGYHLIEAPAIRWGERIARRLAPERA